jgi:conjugal transfer mating pair stabilization protein TraG
LRVRADDARAGFDAKDGTSRSADGTLSTEKSLLLQTGRQVAADASSTLDEARKAAGDLLKKKR